MKNEKSLILRFKMSLGLPSDVDDFFTIGFVMFFLITALMSIAKMDSYMLDVISCSDGNLYLDDNLVIKNDTYLQYSYDYINDRQKENLYSEYRKTFLISNYLYLYGLPLLCLIYSFIFGFRIYQKRKSLNSSSISNINRGENENENC